MDVSYLGKFKQRHAPLKLRKELDKKLIIKNVA